MFVVTAEHAFENDKTRRSIKGSVLCY